MSYLHGIRICTIGKDVDLLTRRFCFVSIVLFVFLQNIFHNKNKFVAYLQRFSLWTLWCFRICGSKMFRSSACLLIELFRTACGAVRNITSHLISRALTVPWNNVIGHYVFISDTISLNSSMTSIKRATFSRTVVWLPSTPIPPSTPHLYPPSVYVSPVRQYMMDILQWWSTYFQLSYMYCFARWPVKQLVVAPMSSLWWAVPK